VHKGLQLSQDGYELTFAVNHLGHFLLINLLLAHLVRHAPARIVIVSSGVHDPSRRTGMPKPAVTDWETLAATGPAHTPGTRRSTSMVRCWFPADTHRHEEYVLRKIPAECAAVGAFAGGWLRCPPGSGLVP